MNALTAIDIVALLGVALSIIIVAVFYPAYLAWVFVSLGVVAFVDGYLKFRLKLGTETVPADVTLATSLFVAGSVVDELTRSKLFLDGDAIVRQAMMGTAYVFAWLALLLMCKRSTQSKHKAWFWSALGLAIIAMAGAVMITEWL